MPVVHFVNDNVGFIGLGEFVYKTTDGGASWDEYIVNQPSSGFTTSSLIQSGFTSSANFLVKKSTGKTIAEHAFASISKDILEQTYMPKELTQPTSQKLIKNILKKRKILQKTTEQSFLSN